MWQHVAPQLPGVTGSGAGHHVGLRHTAVLLQPCELLHRQGFLLQPEGGVVFPSQAVSLPPPANTILCYTHLFFLINGIIMGNLVKWPCISPCEESVKLYGAFAEWLLLWEKSKCYERKPPPVSLHQLQILQMMTWNRTQSSALRNQHVTTWCMTRNAIFILIHDTRKELTASFCKGFPVHTTKAYMGTGSIAWLIFNLSNWWRWAVNFMPQLLYPQERTQISLNKR